MLYLLAYVIEFELIWKVVNTTFDWLHCILYYYRNFRCAVT